MSVLKIFWQPSYPQTPDVGQMKKFPEAPKLPPLVIQGIQLKIRSIAN